MNKNALVLIDCWSKGPTNPTYVKYPEYYIQVLPSEVSLVDGDLIISYNKMVRNYCGSEITTLFYCGFFLDKCVMFNNEGIVKSHETGFDVVLIRDCALPHPDTSQYEIDELFKRAERIGKTITVEKALNYV